jgi:ribose 5-phosphate isomerase B
VSTHWKIAVGSDEAGLALKNVLADVLRHDERVTLVEDHGVHDAGDATAYPNVALDVARTVADGRADRALLVCGTGIGMAITANKVTGIRATVAHDSYSVERSVLSNNCQVLALGARVIGPELAKHLVREWLDLQFDESSASAEKVEVISRYEADVHP